jgi:hypothetical protein
MAIYDVYCKEKLKEKMSYSVMSKCVFIRSGFSLSYFLFPLNVISSFLRGFWVLSIIIFLSFFSLSLFEMIFFKIPTGISFALSYIFSAFFGTFAHLVEEGILILRGWHKVSIIEAKNLAEAKKEFFIIETADIKIYKDEKFIKKTRKEKALETKIERRKKDKTVFGKGKKSYIKITLHYIYVKFRSLVKFCKKKVA